jgi:hypothetical protein
MHLRLLLNFPKSLANYILIDFNLEIKLQSKQMRHSLSTRATAFISSFFQKFGDLGAAGGEKCASASKKPAAVAIKQESALRL